MSFKRTSCYLSLHKLSQKFENGTPANPSDEAETLNYSYYLQKIRWENFNTAWTDACLRLRRQISTNCLSEFDNSVVLALKGLSKTLRWSKVSIGFHIPRYCLSPGFRTRLNRCNMHLIRIVKYWKMSLHRNERTYILITMHNYQHTRKWRHFFSFL